MSTAWLSLLMPWGGGIAVIWGGRTSVDPPVICGPGQDSIDLAVIREPEGDSVVFAAINPLG